MPHGDLAFHAVALATVGRAEVLLDDLLVGGVGNVELAGLHVLHLWVVLQLLHVDVVATHEQNTLDLKAGLLAEHAELAHGVLLEALQSLTESLKHVLEHVANLSLFADLLVVKKPE